MRIFADNSPTRKGSFSRPDGSEKYSLSNTNQAEAAGVSLEKIGSYFASFWASTLNYVITLPQVFCLISAF